MNIVSSQRKTPGHDESNYDKKDKYLNDEVVSFSAKGQGFNQDNWLSIQGTLVGTITGIVTIISLDIEIGVKREMVTE